MLLRVHDIRPSDRDRTDLSDANQQVLFFLRGERPRLSGGHPLSADILQAVRELQPAVAEVKPVLVHMDYWQGNVLWHEGRISAVVDWDFGAYGDPAIDVAYFRMNMYLRGIKEAADVFLRSYEEGPGKVVQNLGFRELCAAAQPLPHPVLWIPASREMGDPGATDERATTDYYEFVSEALRRAYAGR
jgi:aminoglycoside phosphotransferase (APT) family kinase protein